MTSVRCGPARGPVRARRGLRRGDSCRAVASTPAWVRDSASRTTRAVGIPFEERWARFDEAVGADARAVGRATHEPVRRTLVRHDRRASHRRRPRTHGRIDLRSGAGDRRRPGPGRPSRRRLAGVVRQHRPRIHVRGPPVRALDELLAAAAVGTRPTFPSATPPAGCTSPMTRPRLGDDERVSEMLRRADRATSPAGLRIGSPAACADLIGRLPGGGARAADALADARRGGAARALRERRHAPAPTRLLARSRLVSERRPVTTLRPTAP